MSKRNRRKINELEEKRKRRRIIIESSSDSDVSSEEPKQDEHNVTDDLAPAEPDPADPELDPEILTALGEPTDQTPKFADKIHQSLVKRWDPILKNGLLKETKNQLYKKYLVPENCTLLQAPKLNEEVAAAISEAARHRDKRKETEQQQLGVGIAAISGALTLLLIDNNKLEAIKMLSEGGRILTDLHYQQTSSRKAVINYSLAKPFLNIVHDTERDDTLYGRKLGEKIKASKTIEKQGLSIKKFVKTQKTSSTTEQTASSSKPYQHYNSYQGNWSGPPRFQQNRGGRRGTSRSSNVSRRLPARHTSNAPSSSKTRAHATRQ